jgi:hypothetical protein
MFTKESETGQDAGACGANLQLSFIEAQAAHHDTFTSITRHFFRPRFID